MNTGEKINRWTVLCKDRAKKDHSTRFWCQCICGTIRSVPGSSLRSGKSKGCGCGQDLTGLTFARLYVIARAKERKEDEEMWFCQCECGETVNVRSKSLKYGLTQSCGCLLQTLNLEGMGFGLLTVVRREAGSKWLCQCECGNKIVRLATTLKPGQRSSCGCSSPKSARSWHGMSMIPEYRIWSAMRARCHNPLNKAYKHYGGRGIYVCEEWRSFEQFIKDVGLRPKDNYSLERVDNNQGYNKENVIWADKKTQMSNRRTTIRISHNGEVMSCAEWSRKLGLPYSVIRHRWSVGDRSPEIFRPVMFQNRPRPKSSQ